MGREVRKVPAGWEHPRNYSGAYKPLLDGFESAVENFQKRIESHGLVDALSHFGGGPNPDNYMLVGVDPAERTMLMMYEDTTEGTPISPAFNTPEELARWLADTGASAFGYMTATYEQWLSVCKSGWCPSVVIENGVVRSGAEAM